MHTSMGTAFFQKKHAFVTRGPEMKHEYGISHHWKSMYSIRQGVVWGMSKESDKKDNGERVGCRHVEGKASEDGMTSE